MAGSAGRGAAPAWGIRGPLSRSTLADANEQRDRHIKAFCGTTPNAVKAQLWSAAIVYVLTVKRKQRYELRPDLNEVLQVLSVTLLEKTPVSQLFSEMRHAAAADHNQLLLFKI